MTRRLAEVARKVGVSEATVSRVLNERPGVSEPTRQAVLTALDVLGYERPTKLRGERARLVGLVLPELQNPIFPAFAEVVGGALAQRGFTPVLCTQTAGGVSEADYVDLLLQQQVSGHRLRGRSLCPGGRAARALRPPGQRGTCRRCWSTPPSRAWAFPCVSCDDSVAIEQAMGHLLSLGHTRIGLLVGPPDHVPSQRKLAAARAVAARSGISLEPDQIVHSHYSLEGAQASAMRLLETGVSGIVCASDPMALGAIRAAKRSGLNVPRDVSVVGFDDSALMNSIDPPLTTVRQPIEPMCRMIIELLVGQIEGTACPMTSCCSSPSWWFEARPLRRPRPGRAVGRRA